MIGAALFVAALLVRVVVAEKTHYTFNDEYLYMRHAAEMAHTGRFTFASQPPLLIYLYALAFELFGASSSVTFAFTAVVGSLTPSVLYWVLRRLGADRTVALVSSILLVLHPLHVKHSGASSLEVASLLFLLLALGCFLRWLVAPDAGRLFCLAASLFAALTVRVENFALPALLLALALLWHLEWRWPPRWHWAVLAVVVGIAALYLPGVVSFHGEQDDWWKSGLAPLALLLNNLAFWIGGSVATGKVPLLLLLSGLLFALWRTPRAALAMLLLLFLYSSIYVFHGENLGYYQEPRHPPYFATRSGGHDMFRFNVILLPAIVFFLGSGLVAWVRAGRAALARLLPPHGERSATLTAGAVVLVAAVLAVLAAFGGEYRTFDPIGLLRSPYNRPLEISEYHFLEDAFAGLPAPSRCYTFPSPIEPFLGDQVEIVQIGSPEDIDAANGRAFFYVNTRQLDPETAREQLPALRRRFELDEVTRAEASGGELLLFRLRPRAG